MIESKKLRRGKKRRYKEWMEKYLQRRWHFADDVNRVKEEEDLLKRRKKKVIIPKLSSNEGNICKNNAFVPI